MMQRSLLVLMLTIGLACSHRKGTQAGSAAQPGEFTLRVINHHFLDVTIYLIHDGERSRMGQVTATSTETFVLPERWLGQTRRIVLIAEAIGSPNAVRTDGMIVLPGQLVEWTLETDLARSSVGVY